MQVNTNYQGITALQDIPQSGKMGRQQAVGNQFMQKGKLWQELTPSMNNVINNLISDVGSTSTPAGLQGSTGATTSSNSALSTDEANTLTWVREEEKLARDVYRTLYDQWGVQAFANIADSEQKHMDTMASMLDKYGLEDPVKDNSVGSFTNPELANLYQDLVSKGSGSLENALQVGAYIEELDMLDLQNAMDETGQASLDQAYANLMKGSRNHLRSFSSLIENQGSDYQAQILDQTQVDQITDSPAERGRTSI